MTKAEIDIFAKEKGGEADHYDEGVFLHSFPYPYFEKGNAIGISKEKIASMTRAELDEYFNRFNVEQITRITGYMTRVSGWNAGKRGELKDRVRHTL